VWKGGGIKILNRMGGRGLDLCEAPYGHVAGCCECDNELKGSVK